MKKEVFSRIKLFPGLFLMFYISSCVPANKLSYFNDIDVLGRPLVNPRVQNSILPFDRLYIRILSIDPQTRAIFDMPEAVRYSGTGNSVLGYLVDEAGNIEFPFVGKINVGSLSLTDAGKKIQSALNEYVPNTTILVKFIDNQISVLGEVQQQGVYSFSQDKLNIYEALALGGGLTRYGNRQNVILIRHEGEKIMHHKLNLSNSQIAGKEQYYVLPNDVIVVEPLKSISTSYTNITFTTLLSAVTTMIAILVFAGVRIQ
ncbi:MAG: polysaccharide biosynthesis/export family protein [Bacteroidales bacterium]